MMQIDNPEVTVINFGVNESVGCLNITLTVYTENKSIP